jgi:hypothetical protein
MSQFLELYRQLGPEEFSKAVEQLAPYFGTIDPEITELKPGSCEAMLRNQKEVHNHLGTIHAIAMCNAADVDFSRPGEVSVPLAAIDEEGTKCFTAKITMNVKG